MKPQGQNLTTTRPEGRPDHRGSHRSCFCPVQGPPPLVQPAHCPFGLPFLDLQRHPASGIHDRLPDRSPTQPPRGAGQPHTAGGLWFPHRVSHMHLPGAASYSDSGWHSGPRGRPLQPRATPALGLQTTNGAGRSRELQPYWGLSTSHLGFPTSSSPETPQQSFPDTWLSEGGM